MQIKTGKITRTQKCVIYGCEGVGKSTFASKFPKPLFADLEGGTAHLDVPRISDLNTWETLLSEALPLSDTSRVKILGETLRVLCC